LPRSVVAAVTRRDDRLRQKLSGVWINLRAGMAKVAPESGTHICLRAKSTADVDAFHAAALGAAARQTVRRVSGPTIG